MKVGIITIIDYTNYGNRLQNYALDYLLKKKGIEVKSGLLCDVKQDWIDYSGSTPKKILKHIYPFSVFKAKKQYALNIDDPLLKKRYDRFLSFTNQYMDTFPYICVRDSKELAKKINEPTFDYFIAGSDQIWNPYWCGHEYDFLNFTKTQKRLSFAASIGADEIPDERKMVFKNYLSQMKLISLREKDSVDLIENLTGRNDVQYTLDPTLLLTSEEWNEVSKKPNLNLENDYYCTYFLGDTPESIKKLAKEKNRPIYALNNRTMEDLFILDPAEFIYLISHSKMMFTDSFHAAAFSIIFHRDFYIFRRSQTGVEDMFIRLKSLTDFFELQDRIVDENKFELKGQITDKKWTESDIKRAHERERSLRMLIEAMN